MMSPYHSVRAVPVPAEVVRLLLEACQIHPLTKYDEMSYIQGRAALGSSGARRPCSVLLAIARSHFGGHVDPQRLVGSVVSDF